MCTYCMRRKSRAGNLQVQRPTTQRVRTRLYTRRAPRPASARRTLGFLLQVLVFLSKSQPAVFTVAGFFFFFRYPKADAHTTTPGEMGALAKGLLRQGSVIGAQLSRRMDWRADVDAGLPRLVAGTLARLLLPVARHAAGHALLFQTARSSHLTGLPSAPESKRPLWLEAPRLRPVRCTLREISRPRSAHCTEGTSGSCSTSGHALCTRTKGFATSDTQKACLRSYSPAESSRLRVRLASTHSRHSQSRHSQSG